jgi:hypothetical protein
MSVKLAVTEVFAFMVTVQVFVVELHPVQLENWYPDTGVAVRVTTVPELNDMAAVVAPLTDFVILPFVAEVARV